MTPQRTDPFKYFRIESAELIDQLTRGCLALEKGGREDDVVKELNRAAHSLKGAARLVELFPAGDAAHALEDALARLLEHDSAPTRDEVTALLEQVDGLQQIIDDALQHPGQGEESNDAPATVTVEEEPPGAEQSPEPITARTGRLDVSLDPSAARESLRSPSAGDARCEAPGATIATEQIARVSTNTLDEIGRCAGQLLELGSQMGSRIPLLHRMRRSILSVATTLDKARQATEWGVGAGANEAGTDRHRDSRLRDSAFRRIDTAELRTYVEDVLQEIDRGLEAIGPLGDRLHRLTIEARMVSIGEVAHRFEKTVRDTVSQTGHEARLDLLGDNIRVDRTVLQKLTEPICHLLRNAVTHGFETPAQRLERNKPGKRQIRLMFKKSAESIRVIVEDDGAGLDVERIRRAARAANNPDSPSGDLQAGGDVGGLIFRPGVTTRGQPSMVAGRGIGLDIVQNAVQQLRGTVRVDSGWQQFCRFTIDVPCSLDVMDVFVLDVGGQDLLVPMASLVRTCVAQPESIYDYAGAEAILLDDRSVRLLPLASLVGIPSKSAGSGRFEVAVLKSGDSVFAVTVDALKGKQRAVIKNAGSELGPCNVVAGAAIMSDGRPGFLLDPAVLADLANNKRISVRDTAEAKPVVHRTVLVVDDSLTTRMLEKALLESAGYRVLLARDGAEGLGLLAQSSCDLIVVDFEMPGMDGLELTRSIREMPGLADVPIIMLTSRGKDEDKRKGLAAGLQAYLVKGQFDQSEFLSTVRGLIGEPREQT